MKSVSVRTSSMNFLTLLLRDMAQTGAKKWLTLAQERWKCHQKLGMIYYLKVIYYLTVMEKFGCSMLYLILNLMSGMGHEEPWMFIWLQVTKGGVVDLGFPDESGSMVGSQAIVGCMNSRDMRTNQRCQMNSRHSWMIPLRLYMAT